MSTGALLVPIFALSLFSAAPAQQRPPVEVRRDAALARTLEELLDGFAGDVGLYVRHLGTGREVAIRADETFPTASLVKVPIMLALFERVESGALDYHAPLTYSIARLYAGEDLLGSFQDGEKITLQKLVSLMITYSDNTASLWCQELAGTGTAINAWLDRAGFPKTRVNSRTDGRRADWEKMGWGQTTPREMAELLVRIRQGTIVSPAASEEMYRVLTRIFWDGEALSQLPPTVQAASKQGAVNQSRSEVVLVNAPSGDYVFCVITKNQEDQSWARDNAGYLLLRRISAALWRHFEPRAPAAAAADPKY